MNNKYNVKLSSQGYILSFQEKPSQQSVIDEFNKLTSAYGKLEVTPSTYITNKWFQLGGIMFNVIDKSLIYHWTDAELQSCIENYWGKEFNKNNKLKN